MLQVSIISIGAGANVKAMKTIGFIPCRAASERVKNKNTRPFAGYKHGLLELKLRQMGAVAGFDEIIVSSNDPEVLKYAANFSAMEDSRVKPILRPEIWGGSNTSMGEFISEYIADLRLDGHLLWTHVTHPFVTAEVYTKALAVYAEKLSQGYDCLVSSTKIQKFLWRDGRPFNYDNSAERWPRSQDLEPVYEINHAIYALSFQLMRQVRDRVGLSPYFFELDEGCAMDIDWEEQFLLTEEIASARQRRGVSLI